LYRFVSIVTLVSAVPDAIPDEGIVFAIELPYFRVVHAPNRE
jgi:hypothetical protein